MTRQTVSKYIKGLLNNNLVVIARRFGKTKLYELNRNHKLVKALIPYMRR
jgi:DNA-binding transcriptional ArsR family regulator